MLRNLIKLPTREKAGSHEKSWTCVFPCSAFLRQSFLVLVSNLIWSRNIAKSDQIIPHLKKLRKVGQLEKSFVSLRLSEPLGPPRTTGQFKKKTGHAFSHGPAFLNYPAPRSRTVRKVPCIIGTFRTI